MEQLVLSLRKPGADLCGSHIFLEDDGCRPELAVSKRFGIDYAE